MPTEETVAMQKVLLLRHLQHKNLVMMVPEEVEEVVQSLYKIAIHSQVLFR